MEEKQLTSLPVDDAQTEPVADQVVTEDEAPAPELTEQPANETAASAEHAVAEAAATDDPDAPVPDELQTPPVTETASTDSVEAVDSAQLSEEAVSPEQLPFGSVEEPKEAESEATRLAVLEAIVYVTDEPLTLVQIAKALGQPESAVKPLLDQLVEEYNKPWHGLTVKEVAGGYKMATKPEHHEAVRTIVRNLNPPLKLSLAALETLAVIAYKQPITAPEIMEIRGVQGAGVLKTLIDRKLITTAGRKNVVGKPILYKTTREFLVQFGLRDLNELPTLKEFEDLRRMAFTDQEIDAVASPSPEPEPVPESVEEPEPVSESAANE